MQKQFFALLVLFVLIPSYYSFYINLTKQQCFFFHLSSGLKAQFKYVISGVNEDQVLVKVYDTFVYQSVAPIKELAKKKEAEVDVIGNEHSQITICVVSTDNKQKILEFDFVKEENDKFVVTSDLERLQLESSKLYRSIQQVYRNLKFKYSRESTHDQIIRSTISRINYGSFAKMIIMILICGLQIFFLTRYFRTQDKIVV